MASNVVGFVIRVRDLASQGLNRLGRSILSLGSGFRQVGTWVRNATREWRESHARMSTIARRFSSATGSMLGKIGLGFTNMSAQVTAAGAAIVGFATKAARSIRETELLSRRLGDSFNTLRQLSGAALAEGAEADDLQSALGDLQQRALTAQDDFANWGIAIKDANGEMLSASELLMNVADRMATTTNATQALAMADELMSDAGRRLLPVLIDGSAALREKMKAADAAGWSVSETARIMSDELMTSMRGFRRGLAELSEAILESVGPDMIQVIDGFNQGFRNAAAEIRQSGEGIRRVFIRVLKFIEIVLEYGPMIVQWGSSIAAGLSLASGVVSVFSGNVVAAIQSLLGVLSFGSIAFSTWYLEIEKGTDKLAEFIRETRQATEAQAALNRKLNQGREPLVNRINSDVGRVLRVTENAFNATQERIAQIDLLIADMGRSSVGQDALAETRRLYDEGVQLARENMRRRLDIRRSLAQGLRERSPAIRAAVREPDSLSGGSLTSQTLALAVAEANKIGKESKNAAAAMRRAKESGDELLIAIFEAFPETGQTIRTGHQESQAGLIGNIYDEIVKLDRGTKEAISSANRAASAFRQLLSIDTTKSVEIQQQFDPTNEGVGLAQAQQDALRVRLDAAKFEADERVRIAREAVEAISVLEDQIREARDETVRRALAGALKKRTEQVEQATEAAREMQAIDRALLQAGEVVGKTQAANEERRHQQALENGRRVLALGDQIGSSISNVFSGLASGTMNAGQAMVQVLNTVLQTVLQVAVASIKAAALETGAKSASSVAATPFIGPALAVGALSAGVGLVMALLNQLPSAHTGLLAASLSGTSASALMAPMPGRSSGAEGLLRVRGEETIRTRGQEQALQRDLADSRGGNVTVIQNVNTLTPPTGPDLRAWRRNADRIAEGYGVASRRARVRRS